MPKTRFEGSYDKLLVRVLYVALAFSVCCSFGVLGDFRGSSIVEFVGKVIPAVGRVSSKTTYPQIAAATMAFQWLLFPAYLILLVLFKKPWTIPRIHDEATRRDLRRRARALVPFAAFCIWFVLADGDWVVGPSFFQGTIWDPTISTVSFPFHSRLGLAIAAFISPFVEAVMYWLVPSIVCRYMIGSFVPIQ